MAQHSLEKCSSSTVEYSRRAGVGYIGRWLGFALVEMEPLKHFLGTMSKAEVKTDN